MYKTEIFIIFLLAPFCFSQDIPTVKSHLGKISGHYKVSSKGNQYEAYEGIPYALPPVGNRRFMPPEPIQPWKITIEANKFPNPCIGLYRRKTVSGDNINGIEDCLYLNVYKPIKKTNATLPVIFWIYGGAFQYSSFDGTEQNYLIDHDIIFVSLNYRHGTLGFLSTEDEVVAGNMGLKDQAVALKWVSDNIECFGGDPKKITLTGLSAGGASVHYHYLSPMSKGLFRSGISFSGTAFDSWTQVENSRGKAIKLGRIMNCSTDDIIQMVDCLRTRPARGIVWAQSNFMSWHLNEFTPFGPVVEKCSKSPFIDRPPIDIINSGDVYDAPWITGVVSEEGLYPVAELATNKTAFEDLDKNWDSIAPHLLQYYYTVPKRDHAVVAKKIRKHYFGKSPISQANFLNFTHLVGDKIFIVDAEKAARVQSKANRNPVWFYYYSYRATFSASDLSSNTTENYGVSHGDDVILVLDRGIANVDKTPKDFAMHQELTRFWLSVAGQGVPNFGPVWTPVNSNKVELNYLHMIEPGNFKDVTNKNLGEKQFWKTIDFNENKSNQRYP